MIQLPNFFFHETANSGLFNCCEMAWKKHKILEHIITDTNDISTDHSHQVEHYDGNGL